MTTTSVEDVQRDPFCLDSLDVTSLKARPRVIVSNEPYEPAIGDVAVRFVEPARCAFLHRICSEIPGATDVLDWFIELSVAVQLVLALRRPGAAGLVSLGKHSGSIFCFLNSFRWLQGGPVLAYRVLMPAKAGRINRYFISRSLRNVTLIAVWSRAQIENYHQAFGVPREKFVFLPYKANHSQRTSHPMRVGEYVFSGGNSERDYQTLFTAVDGLDIPVIVSVTKPAITRGLTVPANVMLISAPEPAFERLMSGSRIVVVCLKADIIRGSGEATILNAMWHSRPVVIADNISASDYIIDGVDGFVVPAGAAEPLRRRILELWKDPALADRVGDAGRSKVARLYTHQQFKIRMQAIAMLMFERRQTVRA